jgi:hypothetical protein
VTSVLTALAADQLPKTADCIAPDDVAVFSCHLTSLCLIPRPRCRPAQFGARSGTVHVCFVSAERSTPTVCIANVVPKKGTMTTGRLSQW